MPAIIKNNFRRRSAKQFIRTVAETDPSAGGVAAATSNYYLFVGKPLPWKSDWLYPHNTSGVTITDTNADLKPPPPLDTHQTDSRVWDEMLALKRISPGDVSLVIPRSTWKSNVVYAKFSDADPDLFNHPTPTDGAALVAKGLITYNGNPVKPGAFYALNSRHELFICLDNNNNGISLQEPLKTGSPTVLVDHRTPSGDGYVWKYITSVPSGDAVKFLTDSWIPVKTLLNDDGSEQWDVQEDADENAGSVLTTVVNNTSTQRAKFANTYTGTLTVDAVDTGVCVLGASANTTTANVYNGYELKIQHGSPTQTYLGKIVAYDQVTRRVQVQPSLPTSLAGTTIASAKIQPRLIVYSNSTTDKCSFTPVLNSDSEISAVKVDAPGKNATFVSIQVDPLPIHSDGAVQSTIRPILSTATGLGADPEKDLGAFFVMISVQLRSVEGADPESETKPNLTDFPVANDYRQIGVIKDVRQNVGTPPALCVAPTVNATKKLEVSFTNPGTTLGDPGFKSDEEITLTLTEGGAQITGTAKVIDFKFYDKPEGDTTYTGQLTIVQTPETKYLEFMQTNGSAKTYQIQGTKSGAVASVTGVLVEELKKFEGEILYLENRRPVLRAADQVEDIKTIIEF